MYRDVAGEGCLERLADLARRGDNLDRTSVLCSCGREFISRVYYHFGSYYGALQVVHDRLSESDNESGKKLAERVDVDYWKSYARLRNLRRTKERTKSETLDQLVFLIKKGSDLDGASIERADRKLFARLRGHYGNYYAALEAAKKRLEKDDPQLASEINIVYWKREAHKRSIVVMKKKAKLRRRRASRKINVIEQDRIYTCKEISSLGIQRRTGSEMSGQAIQEFLEKSPKWLSTEQIGTILDLSSSVISQNFPLNFSSRTVKCRRDGDVRGRYRSKYFFHRDILEAYKRRDRSHFSGDSSVQVIAKRYGIKRSTLKSLVKRMGLDLGSDKGTRTLREILSWQKERKKRIIASLSSSQDCTIGELRRMGVPVGHFISAGGKSDNRVVRGEDVLRYFRTDYQLRYSSFTFRLLNRFYPHLCSVPDLIDWSGMQWRSVYEKIDVLIKENPESCFVFRTPKSKKVITSPLVLSILQNWRHRSGIQLVNMVSKLNESCSQDELEEVVDDSRELISNGRIEKDKQKKAFEAFRTLRDFLNVGKNVNGVFVSRGDLALLYRYMVNRQYPLVEIGRPYTLEELASVLDQRILMEKAMKSEVDLKYALYSSNLGLIHQYKKEHSVRGWGDWDAHFFEDALIRAIELYDPRVGAFSTYVYQWMGSARARRARKRRKKEISLDRKVSGRDSKLGDFIEDDTFPETFDLVSERELNQGILDGVNTLVDRLLSGRLKKIIKLKFGLGCERRTEDEIARQIGVTHQRINQLSQEALIILKESPEMEKLHVSLS